LTLSSRGRQAGQDASLLPDKKKALSSMTRAYKIFTDTSDEASDELGGTNIPIEAGAVEFKSVVFAYANVTSPGPATITITPAVLGSPSPHA
jgi:hypothetical protein